MNVIQRKQSDQNVVIISKVLLKALFNIVEDRFKNCWTLMSMLDDV